MTRCSQYLNGLQASFTRFVKGQSLLGFSVGLAAGLGVWILGWDVVDIWPEGSQYALLFGVWAGITEVIPYVGPWLGAFPPVVLALFHSPVTALWVALIFFIVQMLENHILVPNIMGATSRRASTGGHVRPSRRRRGRGHPGHARRSAPPGDAEAHAHLLRPAALQSAVGRRGRVVVCPRSRRAARSGADT